MSVCRLTTRRLTTSRAFAQNRVTPGGFTLVEILIVVIILGILASIVIPQFSNASHLAREATLRDDLRFMRLQVGAYRVQHRDVSPGYSGGHAGIANEATFVAQMTLFSDEYGNTAAAPSDVCTLGPYLSRVPMNPLTSGTTVLVVGDDQPMPDPSTFPIMDGTLPYAWIYQPQTQSIMANNPGVDTAGMAYSAY